MKSIIFAAVLGVAVGVLLRDQAEDYRPKPQAIQIPQSVLGAPIICDATVEQRSKPTEPWSRKCYVARYQR